MLNRSQIMQTAWTTYRAWFAARNRPFKFNRSDFAVYLAAAWRTARAAQMTATEARADRIRLEIDALRFKAARINVDAARQRLTAELAAL